MQSRTSIYRGYTEAQARAHRRYMEGFAEVKCRMTPEQRDAVKRHAAARGESVSRFINRAIAETMERDNNR